MKLTRWRPLAAFALASAVLVPATPAAAADGQGVEVGDFTFQIAKPWSKGEPASAMVKAVAEIKPEGATGALQASFFYFGPGQGGSVEANVARWTGQFEGEPEVATRKLKFGDTKVTILEAKGTFLSGPPFGAKTPTPGFTLLGAIIEGKSAPVFIRMTGPQDDVAKVRGAFEKLVASAFGGTEPVEAED
jgi:hypothetical protein